MAKSKLIRMATQMLDFFRNQKDVPAAEAVAGHINTYWTYTMRREFIAELQAGAEADPILRDSISYIQLPEPDREIA